MDLDEKLEWMAKEYLSEYEAISVDSQISRQTPFSSLRKISRKYPVASNEPLENNTYLSYNMAIGTSLDRKLYQAFEILDYALLNAPGAPLKKALLDAGIGRDIMGSYENGTYQPYFSIVAKNANKQDETRFREIILNVLKEQADGGLNKKSVLAAINSAEFRYRESDFGAYPKGLIYGLQILDSWLYDDALPFLHLEASEVFQFLRSQADKGYFEKLIQDYMIDNSHASMVIIEPERGLNVKNEQELVRRLSEYKNSLNENEIQALISDTENLKKYQEEPSSREDIEKIPMLKRTDMRKEALPLQLLQKESKGTKILHTELFSNGILYLNLMFDVRTVTEEELPYLGILKSVLGYVDTQNYTYDDLANEINLQTGGMSAVVSAYDKAKEPGAYEAKFEIRTKVLYDKLSKAAGLLKEILTASRLDDEKRLKEILSEVKSRLKMSMQSAANSVAAPCLIFPKRRGLAI